MAFARVIPENPLPDRHVVQVAGGERVEGLGRVLAHRAVLVVGAAEFAGHRVNLQFGTSGKGHLVQIGHMLSVRRQYLPHL